MEAAVARVTRAVFASCVPRACTRTRLRVLWQVCEGLIESELAQHNVCRALIVADKHQAASLKKTCITFIVANFRTLSTCRNPDCPGHRNPQRA